MWKKHLSVLSLCIDDYNDVVNLNILWKYLRYMAFDKRGKRNVKHIGLDSETLLLRLKVMTSTGKSRRIFHLLGAPFSRFTKGASGIARLPKRPVRAWM